MNEGKSWHEDDAFWEAMTPIMFGESSWTAASVEVEQVLDLLHVRPGAAILDLGCGPGRHSLELARRGFRVTGVDRTAAYLAKALEQATSEGLSIAFRQDDMRTFCQPDAFDAAILLFTTFGYFEDAVENRQVLANVCDSLRQGGMLVIELMGKEILARIFRERDWRERDGAILLEERQIVDDWNRIENRWILLQGQNRREFTVSHWLYSAAELSALLTEVGFSTVDVYGDLEGAAYDHRAKRLVTVARK